MALSTRIEARQHQSLVMTPQLRQSIKLLHMTNMQLAEFVAAEVEKNPLLELAAPPPVSAAPRAQPRGGAGLGPASALEAIAARVTLRDHLREQLGAARAGMGCVRIALILADELDEDGYLRQPLPELAARHGVTQAALAEGLALLQTCDPAGIGARDLAECLALQLRERDRLDPAMQALLANLALAAEGRIAQLRTLCGVDAADLADMLIEIRALDPRPGQRFAHAPIHVAIPDVHVHGSALAGWRVEIDSETLPRVLVNNVYRAGLGGRDAATRAFISECNTQANWLVRSLAQRARTILRVATDIVTHQQLFFSLGVARMRPLTQRAVAERLGLHESTISRVAAGKYLSCDQGLYEMRFFFTSSIQATRGGEGFAGAAVQERVRQLIQAERGPRTLSDDNIVRVLNAEGIDIARRTVAKYREALGIPSSVERRRLKAATPSHRPACYGLCCD